MKNKKENINKLINKVINETLSDKADNLVRNINELGGMEDNHPKFGKLNLMTMSDEEIDNLLNQKIDNEDEDWKEWSELDIDKDFEEEEFTEGFDSEEIFKARRGVDYSPREFKRIPKGADVMGGLDMDSREVPPSLLRMMNLKRRPKKDFDDDFDDFELVNEGEGETCEQCGAKGNINEDETCEQCGWSKTNMEEGIYDVEDLRGEFDYTETEEDLERDPEVSNLEKLEDYCNEDSSLFDEQRCKYNRTALGMSEIKEKLHGRQRKLDKNKNNRIDSEDFEILRGETKKSMRKSSTDVKKGNESLKLTESEMVDLIEKLVKEEQSNLRKGARHKGLTTYEKAHRGSGKENSDYLKSVTKKMKDYLKDGSKGEYSTEPKHFPKGNGELSKMSKKAYIPSDAVQDYTDNLTAAGLENLVYDEINPNEEWVDMNVVGSSKTGNNPEWGNAVETGVNKKRNKVRKDNLLGQIKRKAYNKAPQPIVSDKTGEDEGTKILNKLESTEPKETLKLNEEFGRMKQLLSYNRKTQ